MQSAAYGGTYDLVHKEFNELGITASMVDISQPCDTWTPLLQPNTKVTFQGTAVAASHPSIHPYIHPALHAALGIVS